jgi:hypothetical protein
VTRDDYDGWLSDMGEMGVRVVRIYTILRPAFYDALADYNDDHKERPISSSRASGSPTRNGSSRRATPTTRR